MTLEQLVQRIHALEFPSHSERARPSHAAVRALQDSIRDGLSDDELLVELLALEIEARGGAPGLAPFFAVAELGIRMAFAYWAPGRAAGAHEHNDWTVTAVVHNALQVATFDWDATLRCRQLVPKHRFDAEAGRVGHIYDPCIHEPSNPTRQWSISLHVFGPHDEPRLEREVGPIAGLTTPPAGETAPAYADDPLIVALNAHRRECVRRVQVAALESRGARARRALTRLWVSGDAGTRRRAARALGWRETARRDGLLVRAWPGVTLDLTLGERAELTAHSARHRQPLLRVDTAAASALRHVAAAGELLPAALPGLAAADQLALAQALVDWGVFRPLEATTGETPSV